MGNPRDSEDSIKFSRREALLGGAALIGSLTATQRYALAEDETPFNAEGERVGDVTYHSAIVHTRLTATPERNNRGYSFPWLTCPLLCVSDSDK